LTEVSAERISNAVENMKYGDIIIDGKKLKFENIKVSEFNVDSMKLQKENGAYKVKLDGVNGVLESDATVKRNSKEASANLVGDIYSFESSNYDVTIQNVDGKIKAYVTTCNFIVTEDHVMSAKFSGDPELQKFLFYYFKEHLLSIVNRWAQTEICAVVKPQVQKILDEQNLNEIIG